jgi:hypothetical protein
VWSYTHPDKNRPRRGPAAQGDGRQGVGQGAGVAPVQGRRRRPARPDATEFTTSAGETVKADCYFVCRGRPLASASNSVDVLTFRTPLPGVPTFQPPGTSFSGGSFFQTLGVLTSSFLPYPSPSRPSPLGFIYRDDANCCSMRVSTSRNALWESSGRKGLA